MPEPTIVYTKVDETGKAGSETGPVLVIYMSDGTMRWEPIAR
jgi:hypothetical protein